MTSVVVFFINFMSFLVHDPVITLAVLLAGFIFLKWIFYAHPDDDYDNHSVEPRRNIQTASFTIESIQLKKNKQREKIIDDQIAYSKRKIDVMKENGFVGGIIDNLAGNSIADEQAKIMELEKQKESLKLKIN